jgi:hypothetical protein
MAPDPIPPPSSPLSPPSAHPPQLPPVPSVAPPGQPRPPFQLVLEPLDGPADLGRIFEAVLRRPGQVLHALGSGSPAALVWLLALLLAGLALFGFLLGLFSGGTQLWAAPLKVVLGAAASALICLPSFYIFLCLGGAPVRLKEACGLLLTGLTLVSLLLMALAPVVWLFTQATTSAVCMGFLALGFWLIAIGFGLRLILRGARLGGLSGARLMAVWTVIFLAVTLQMSTSLRPILGTSDRLLPDERRFFLEHWARSLGDRAN